MTAAAATAASALFATIAFADDQLPQLPVRGAPAPGGMSLQTPASPIASGVVFLDSLLLWIIVIFAVMTESMPAPNAFRGEDATASLILFDTVAVTNRGVYIPEPMFDRSLGNLDIGIFLISLDLLAIIAVLVGGLLVNRAILKRATRIQNATGIRPTTWWQSILVILGPLVLLKIALGLHFGLPELRGFNFVGGTHMRNSLVALWLALSVYTGAFIAENVRSGIQAVSRGQTEAARSLGMTHWQTMRFIILPQAVRRVLPPLGNDFIAMLKDSALVSVLGVQDITQMGKLYASSTFRFFETYNVVAFLYLAMTIALSLVVRYMERRMSNE